MDMVLEFLMADARHKLLFCWVSHSKILYQFGLSSLVPYEISFQLASDIVLCLLLHNLEVFA